MDDKIAFEKVINFTSLYNAYKKARNGNGSGGQRKFDVSAFDGIWQLKRLLATKQYSVAPYNSFIVHEPKERIIEAGAFKDKIVQHSLCDNVLLPLLKDEFIQTNVAGQKNKGTLYGLNCLKSHMLSAYQKYGHDCWILKADIHKYFYSIKHNILKDILQYHVGSGDIWWLCEKFIDSCHADVGVGLPLGNQITQVFALLYLSGLDHFITGELGVSFYGRYMDDFYLIIHTKEHARECLESIQVFIQSLGLELNQKTQIIPFKNGIKYCGFHSYVTKNGKYIRKLTNERKRAAQKRYRKMVRLVLDGKMEEQTFKKSYQAWKNHISHGNCVKLGHAMDQYIQNIFQNQVGG